MTDAVSPPPAAAEGGVAAIGAVRRGGELAFWFDLPGAHPEQIKLAVGPGLPRLGLAGRRRGRTDAGGRVALPRNAHLERVSASWRDGVLQVRVPVAEAAERGEEVRGW